jgi:hypothetical protein
VERAPPEICWWDTTLIADKTVQFGWDGVDYEIDLTAEHADEFADAMARYVDLARSRLALLDVSAAPRWAARYRSPTRKMLGRVSNMTRYEGLKTSRRRRHGNMAGTAQQ